MSQVKLQALRILRGRGYGTVPRGAPFFAPRRQAAELVKRGCARPWPEEAEEKAVEPAEAPTGGPAGDKSTGPAKTQAKGPKPRGRKPAKTKAAEEKAADPPEGDAA